MLGRPGGLTARRSLVARRSLTVSLRRKPLTPIDAKPLSGAVLGRLRQGHTCEIRGVARRGEVESLTHNIYVHLARILAPRGRGDASARFFGMVDELRRKGKKLKPEAVEREVADAVRAVRAKARRRTG